MYKSNDSTGYIVSSHIKPIFPFPLRSVIREQLTTFQNYGNFVTKIIEIFLNFSSPMGTNKWTTAIHFTQQSLNKKKDNSLVICACKRLFDFSLFLTEELVFESTKPSLLFACKVNLFFQSFLFNLFEILYFIALIF